MRPRTPMRPRDAVSGRSVLAGIRESARRTRWIGRYVLASSWPGRFGVLDLAVWAASPFGTRLGEVTGETTRPAAPKQLPSRRRARLVESRDRGVTRPLIPASELRPRARSPFS